MPAYKKIPDWMRDEITAIARHVAREAGAELMALAEQVEIHNAIPAAAPVPEPLRALIPAAVAHVTRARARCLEPVREEMDRLIAAARDGQLTSSELQDFLTAAARNLPNLFARLNQDALAGAIEDALGAAAAAGIRTR